MKRILQIGQPVCVATVIGLRGGWELLQVRGRVERVDVRPWGTDALVRLDIPSLVGNLDCNEPVLFLSMSANSPNLVIEGNS